MALPKFTKTGTPEVTLSQEPDLESFDAITPRQTIQRSYDGGFKVLTRGVEDDFLNLVFTGLPVSDVDALEVFFRSDVVNFAGRAFTYTDTDSVAHQLRYQRSNLPGIPISPTARRLSFTFIVDRGTLD